MIIAGVLVVAVIGILVVVMGGKDDPKQPGPTQVDPVNNGPTKPAGPRKRGPVPRPSPALKQAVEDIRPKMEAIGQEAKRLLDTAKPLKSSDRDAWIDGLEAAEVKCGEGRDMFNDFVAQWMDEVTTNTDWPDEEEIITEYIGGAYNLIQKVSGEVRKTKPMK